MPAECVRVMVRCRPMNKNETDKTIRGLIFNQHKIENTVLPQFERDNIEKICDFMVKALEGE